MNLKQLLCNHNWEHISKPQKYIFNMQCTKCGKKTTKHVKWYHTGRGRTYCWCPECDNDLVRDSFVSQSEGGRVIYKCSKCQFVSEWHFGIAAIPILMTGKPVFNTIKDEF